MQSPPLSSPQVEHLPGQLESYSKPQFKNAPHPELANAQGVITCGDVSISIEGSLVPVVNVMLGGNMPIYFEHHIILYKSPSVSMRFRLSGGFKRLFAGMQIFQCEAHGQGNIAFSRDSVGQIVCLRLAPGQTVEVREHQMLFATNNISYNVTMFNGMSNILFSRTGLLIDVFTCAADRPEGGLLVLHGYGNVFEKVLQPGEQLDLEPGGWLWKDPSVRMDTINVTKTGGSHHGFMAKLENTVGGYAGGGGSLFLNRLTGPGRVAIQSMTYHPPQAEGAPGPGGNQNLLGALAQLGGR